MGRRLPVPEVGHGPCRPARLHRRPLHAGRSRAGAARPARSTAGDERGGPGFWAIALLGGVAFFVAAWLQQAGIITATVTNTGFLTALYVVITPFIAWGWRGTAASLIVWPAVALSASAPGCSAAARWARSRTGDQLVALSAVSWAAHVVITGRRRAFAPPDRLHGDAVRRGRRACGIGTALLEDHHACRAAGAAVDIAYVGLLSSALTFTLLTVALQYTPPSEAAVIVSLETVFAALAAYLVLGERLPRSAGWGRR